MKSCDTRSNTSTACKIRLSVIRERVLWGPHGNVCVSRSYPQIFLTGKLAALGIDEDLELSGGEEENDDPSPTVADSFSGCPAGSSGSNKTENNSVGPNDDRSGTSEAPPNGSNMRTGENGSNRRNNADDGRQTCAAQPAAEASSSPSSPSSRPTAERGEKVEAGELEPGELLQMLERPLQTSRSNSHQRQQQQQQQGSSTRGNNKRRSSKPSTSGNNGRAKGRNVTVKECAKWVCERLKEPKYYLMCQVVAEIGYNNSKRLLEEVRQTQVGRGKIYVRCCGGMEWQCCGGLTDLSSKYHSGTVTGIAHTALTRRACSFSLACLLSVF